MNYEIVNVNKEDKEKLYRLLQYALYDGSQYIDNDINEDCLIIILQMMIEMLIL